MIITKGSILEEIYQAWDAVFHQQMKQYTEKRVENTTRSGVFLTTFESVSNAWYYFSNKMIFRRRN